MIATPPGEMHAVPVVVENLSKTWPRQRRLFRPVKEAREVLRDVSFSVRRGEIFTLLGENGAGKTTILKIIGGLAREDTGRVALLGYDDAEGVAEMRRRFVAYGGGERGFYFRLTVRENLSMFGTLDGFVGKRLARRIVETCEVVDLQDELDRPFSDLSTGLRQRVAIARTLLADPQILLLDEPTRTLDPLHADSIRTFIRETLVRKRGKTVLLATNLLDEAYELGDRIGVLRGTRLFTLDRPSSRADMLKPSELFEAEHHA